MSTTPDYLRGDCRERSNLIDKTAVHILVVEDEPFMLNQIEAGKMTLEASSFSLANLLGAQPCWWPKRPGSMESV
jgi:hypothetical protein